MLTPSAGRLRAALSEGDAMFRWPWRGEGSSAEVETIDVAGRAARPEGPANLIVLFDGTSNDETGRDASGVVTNVVKLSRALDTGADRQKVMYFRGIGNDDDFNWFERQRDGLIGGGEGKIRGAAYTAIVREYHPDDRILIFGFSRGAASARRLARDLRVDGIPNRITARKRGGRHRSHESSGGTFEAGVPVVFLGIWDTVGAFGVPVRIGPLNFRRGWGEERFSNTTVSMNVEQVTHLIAVDETRSAFEPTQVDHEERVDEVWFSGVHSDVGGGYRRDALGDITLAYMVGKLKQYSDDAGAGIEIGDSRLRSEGTGDAERKAVTLHWYGRGWIPVLSNRLAGPRPIIVVDDQGPSDRRPRVHRSVLELMERPPPRRSRHRFGRSNVIEEDVPYRPENVATLGEDYEPVE